MVSCFRGISISPSSFSGASLFYAHDSVIGLTILFQLLEQSFGAQWAMCREPNSSVKIIYFVLIYLRYLKIIQKIFSQG